MSLSLGFLDLPFAEYFTGQHKGVIAQGSIVEVSIAHQEHVFILQGPFCPT